MLLLFNTSVEFNKKQKYHPMGGLRGWLWILKPSNKVKLSS